MSALPSLRASELRRRERYPGLQGAWGFDEGIGTVAADSVGNSTFVQTGNISMTLAAGATWVAGHSSGTAVQNPGPNGPGASTSVNVTGTAMTIMGWARPLDLTSGTTRPLFGIWDTSDASNLTFVAIWAQRGSFGTSNVLQGNIRANGSLQALNGSALTVNVWTHLALSYDGANMRLYKDGAEVTSSAQPGAAYTGAAVFCVVPNPSGSHSNAQVDDVRIFNTALTAAEIQSFMQQAVAVP